MSSFRLVYDRDSGRPKGFGFAEYSDAETAASAVRNLNDYEIMNRKLRVDFSHEGAAPPDDYQPAPASAPTPAPPGTGGGGGGLGLPPGADLPPGLTAPDAISATLKQLPPPQLLDVIAQMKALVTSDPAKATELLRQAPQLSYAIFQALLLMNLVEASVLTQVIENAAGGYAHHQPPPPQPQSLPPPPPQPQPPQPQQQPPQQAAPQPIAAAMDPQRQALLQQVMSLTEQQLAALPVEQQQQILMLKAQLMQGGGM